jgi:glutathione S-transferase
MQEPSPTITLFTGQSPNGVKISITLEELGLPYNVRTLDMKINEQKSDWFTKTNPNGRIPAITDLFDDGSEIRVFESGSIMQYLVGRYDTDYKISYPPGTREHVEVGLAGHRHLEKSNVFVDDELAFLSKCRIGTNVIELVR